MNRKKTLSIAVAGVVIIGFLLALIPLIASWKPNPNSQVVLDIDISSVPLGESKKFEWLGKPAIFYRPDKLSEDYLIALNDQANGPNFNKKSMPKFFIYVALSRHLGCRLLSTGDQGHKQYKYIGYFDPCHRGFWDKAGRLLPDVHDGSGLANLQQVTDYTWLSNTTIRIKGAKEVP